MSVFTNKTDTHVFPVIITCLLMLLVLQISWLLLLLLLLVFGLVDAFSSSIRGGQHIVGLFFKTDTMYALLFILPASLGVAISFYIFTVALFTIHGVCISSCS